MTYWHIHASSLCFVGQVKKVNKWICKLCGEKQSQLKVRISPVLSLIISYSSILTFPPDVFATDSIEKLTELEPKPLCDCDIVSLAVRCHSCFITTCSQVSLLVCWLVDRSLGGAPELNADAMFRNLTPWEEQWWRSRSTTAALYGKQPCSVQMSSPGAASLM